MKRFIVALVSVVAVSSSLAFAAPKPQVLIKTNMGEMIIELYPERAPISVANFLQYVDKHFYDGLIFHRVIPKFMIQTGGFRYDFSTKEPDEPIINESDNGLTNSCGTVAMARTRDINSASAQFYINVNNNSHLNARSGNDGYAVFGKVIKGMSIAKAIADLNRGKYQGQFRDAPNMMVQIETVKRVSGQKAYKPKC
ncbi:MAG: peptidylprolyl isomerase [Cellvibrionaceae bacterium]|nr:peptidylprolyl isomerase [Cellvibrionaceae bacterium]